jgi:hypothetical protein
MAHVTILLSPVFWHTAGARALRTMLVAVLPLLAPLVRGDQSAVGQAGLALGLAAVLSLATSLASLPETGTGRTWWAAVLDRAGRTFGQVLAAALAAAAVWSDVDWPLVLTQAAVAALTSAILGIVEQLPETIPLVEAQVAPDGTHVVTTLSVDERRMIDDLRLIEGRPPLDRA